MSNNSQTDQPNNKISRIIKSILIAIFAIIVVALIQNFSDIDFIEMFRPGTKIERVREKMKKELKEEYGEEFVVYNIGLRSATGDKFYQARIYPKSIEGTLKENDRYYYGKATIDKGMFGLGGVADTYGEIKRSIEIEKDLLEKLKKIFGERILLKVDQMYEKKNKNDSYVSYLNPTYEEVMQRIKEEPDRHRLLLELYLYIFDRIDSKQEKEKRRKDIFKFVQYLKEEGLFRYLEMGVIFIDERILAPSYEEYKDKMYDREWITKEIDGETIELPPKNFRRKMSQELQQEIDRMSQKRLIETMQGIRKSELAYEGISRYNTQYIEWIYSIKMLKENYNTSYEEYEEQGILDNYQYINKNDIEIVRDLEYIYIN